MVSQLIYLAYSGQFYRISKIICQSICSLIVKSLDNFCAIGKKTLQKKLNETMIYN